jgi:transposase
MPGLQGQVDWADFQIAEPNGRTNTVYLFILVLGYCRAIYAEFVNRCTLESFLDGHIRAFHYLGGIPAEILYDNMRHVVIRHLVGKVAFNPELLHFAHHYGFAPKARRMRPRSRARWNGRWTTSGRASGGDTVANRRIHGTHRQPVVERWQPEKPQLGALPAADYDDGRSWQVVGTPDVGRSVRRVESSWQSLIAW